MFIERLRAGEPVVGAWVTVGHPVVAEVLAPEFDFLAIDAEHTELSMETVAAMVRAIDATDADCAALVRVSDNDPVEIKRVLDLGVAGVVVPSVDTREEAEAAVEACRYPPAGVRGVAGYRAADYGASMEYVERANDEVATIVQAESGTAAEHAADIAAVDGVDALFVGPADLSASLGIFGEFDAPEFETAIEDIVSGAHDADVPVGTLATSTERVEEREAWGVDFMATGVDSAFLRESAREYRDAYDAARE